LECFGLGEELLGRSRSNWANSRAPVGAEFLASSCLAVFMPHGFATSPVRELLFTNPFLHPVSGFTGASRKALRAACWAFSGEPSAANSGFSGGRGKLQ